MKSKEYLGDGVYVQTDDFGGIWLTTEDGINVTNQIYLEPSVYNLLLEYMSNFRKDNRESRILG